MLENLYASIKKLNDDLLDKTNAPDYIGANFQDAMDFNITCNALSLIKSIMLGNNRALSSMLNIRNLIECFVLLDMDATGDISEEQKDLFLEAYKLIEYKSYSKTEQRDLSSVIDFKELEDYYLQAKAKFEKAGIGKKELKNLQKSRLPFLCDAKINYNVLLEKYAHPYLSPYILLSRLVHPNSFRFPLDPQTYDCLAALIIAQLSDLYGNIEHSGVNNFYQECQLLYAFNLDLLDNHNKKLKDLCESQARLYLKLLRLSTIIMAITLMRVVILRRFKLVKSTVFIWATTPWSARPSLARWRSKSTTNNRISLQEKGIFVLRIPFYMKS